MRTASSETSVASTLSRIINELGQVEAVEDIPTRLLDAVIRTTPFDRSWAAVYNTRTHRMTHQYAAGFDDDATTRRWLQDRNLDPDAREPIIFAIRSGSTVTIPDVLDTPDFPEMSARSLQNGFRSSLHIPVRLTADEWTVLSFYQTVTHTFSQAEQLLAAAIATFAAVAFRNAIARDKAVEAQRRANETVASQNELLQHMAEVQRQLLQAQLLGKGSAAICEVLSEWLRSPVVLLDRFHQIIASVGMDQQRAEELAAEVTITLADSPTLQLDARPTAIMVGGQGVLVGLASDRHSLMGICIAIPSSSFGLEVDTSVMELGCLYLSLEIAHQRVALEAELRLQDDFVSALVEGGSVELARRSSVLGLDLNSSRRVYRARVSGSSRELDAADSSEIADYARKLLLRSVSGAVVAPNKADEFVLVLPEELTIPQACAVIRRALSDGVAAINLSPAACIQVAIGVGDVGTGIGGLAQSQSGATRALEVLSAANRTTEDLYIGNAGSSALLTIPSDVQKLAFVDRYLAGLIEHDRVNSTNLLETLRVYFQQVGNVKRTADQMFLHISTVRHRLERIETLTCTSLRDEDQRLCLQLALRLSDIHSSRRQPGLER